MNSDSFFLIVAAVAFAMLFLFGGQTSDKKIRKNLERQKKRAQHPAPDKSLLRNHPIEGDFILGKYGRRYVCWDTDKDGHFCICGGSGTGKSSSLIIPYLLNSNSQPKLVLDIKGELNELCANGRDRVFSPIGRTWGWSVFYGLTDDSTPAEILQVIQTVVFSLVPLGEGKDRFWNLSARNMLIGLLIYYYGSGKHDFIACIDAILGCPIEDQINEIINTVSPDSDIHRYLIEFAGMAPETLLSVYAGMSNSLSCFSDVDLRWAFCVETPRKVSPKTLLEEERSIYLSVPEHKLAAWAGPLAMIINLTLWELSRREVTPSSKRIGVVIDEMSRIVSGGGCLDGIIDASMTLRSRKVTLIVALQALEGLSVKGGFNENEVTTLVSNMGIRIVLSASSSKTQKTVCNDWVGKYTVKRQSKSTNGGKKNNSYSFEDKPILEPADLNSLGDEAVIITPLGFCMLKKCFYFRDPYLKPLAERNKK